MSIILSIETSSELASVALLRGETVTSRVSSGVRTHSQSVLPMIQELLADAGIALKDCDAIAFAHTALDEQRGRLPGAAVELGIGQ